MLVDHESMIATFGQHNEVPRIDLDPRPLDIIGLANVEVARTVP